MAAAEVVRLNLRAAEIDGGLIAEGDARRRIHLLRPHHVGARVLVREDIGRLDELHIAAGVVAVLMRVDHVFHRKTGDGFHALHDLGEVPLELVVDQDDAFGRDADGDIAAAFGDDVEVLLHLLDLERRALRLLGLNRGEPRDEDGDQRDPETFLHPSLPIVRSAKAASYRRGGAMSRGGVTGVAPGLPADRLVGGLVALEHHAVGETRLRAEPQAGAGFGGLGRRDDAGFDGRDLDAFAGDGDIGEFLVLEGDARVLGAHMRPGSWEALGEVAPVGRCDGAWVSAGTGRDHAGARGDERGAAGEDGGEARGRARFDDHEDAAARVPEGGEHAVAGLSGEFGERVAGEDEVVGRDRSEASSSVEADPLPPTYALLSQRCGHLPLKGGRKK